MIQTTDIYDHKVNIINIITFKGAEIKIISCLVFIYSNFSLLFFDISLFEVLNIHIIKALSPLIMEKYMEGKYLSDFVF